MPPARRYKPKPFGFRYHGNYVGPGWSGGKWQKSVAYSRVKPIDEFDATAMRHDRAYALGRNKRLADYRFYRENIGKGFKRSVAAAAVGAQGVYRSLFPEKDSEMKRNRSKSTTPQYKRMYTPSKSSKNGSMSTKSGGNKKARKQVVFQRLAHKPIYTRGKYAGVQKKGRARKYDNSFNYNGVVSKHEDGSVQTCSISHTAYVGHGIAPATMVENMWRLVVKKLFQKAGIDIRAWTEVVATNLLIRTVVGQNPRQVRIKYSYKRLDGDANGAIQLGITADLFDAFGVATLTYDELAINLGINFQDALTPIEQDGAAVMLNATLFFVDTTTGATVQEDNFVANICFDDMFVDVDISSNLVVQNRTPDSTGGVDADSVTNNPVHGKMYTSSDKWLNGFELKSQELGADPSRIPLYTFQNTGIISTNSADTQPTILRKPPQPWQLGVKRASNVLLQPGEIKRSNLRFTCSMKWNTLMQKLFKYFRDLGIANGPVQMGFAEMFALESVLNVRGGETANLQIGWELNQTYKFKAHFKKYGTAPVLDITV